jgi:4'-phosphopantetheinyl transferase
MTQPVTRQPIEVLADDAVHVWHFACRRAQGRAPLLALLARYTGTDDTVLVIGEHGRPRLAQPQAGLDFNWSHSGELAVLAVARGIAPGIDVECARQRPRAMELARRFFHAEETAALLALPQADRSAAFFELWTAKEAVLKATGRGISFGLDRLRVRRDDRLQLAWLDGDEATAWQLHALALGEGCTAALAWRGGPRRIVVRALATPGTCVQCGPPVPITPTAP